VTVPRLSRDTEKPFRDALGHAIRNEIDEMEEELLRLTDEQILSCLSLCVHVTGYVAINACGGRWPDEEDLRQIGEVATKSNNARAFGLKAQDAYAYVQRVVLGADEHWWEYLNRIEEAWEVAQVTDLDLLPALMFRARRPVVPAELQSPSGGTDAASSASLRTPSTRQPGAAVPSGLFALVWSGYRREAVNRSHAPAPNTSVPPSRLVVSLTAIPLGWLPASTQPPPFDPLWLDLRQRGSFMPSMSFHQPRIAGQALVFSEAPRLADARTSGPRS